MPIIAKRDSEKSFLPHPAGMFPAVCCDVVDLGMVTSNYAGKEKVQHKVRLVWQTSAKMEDGRRFIVGKRYTVSLFEKATLFQDLTSWGIQLSEDDMDGGFDIETLIGLPAFLNVQHKKDALDPKKVYANVVSVNPLPDFAPRIETEGYVRVTERDTILKAAGWHDPVEQEPLDPEAGYADLIPPGA